MMMALDVTHSTFPHHRDLDLDLRHDLDRSPAGSRNKRLRSATEVTSSSRDSAEQSTVRVDPATRFAATSRGPFSKLKLKLARAKSINKPSTAASDSATTDHVDKHGGEFDATDDKTECLNKVTSEDSKQNDKEVTSLNPAVSTDQSAETKRLQRSMSTPVEQTSVKASFNFRPGDEYFDFPCKYQCPQQQFHFANLDSQQSKFMRGKMVTPVTQRGEADGASINTPVVSDRSPLIKNATSPPPIIADATAFDNAAAAVAEPLQETTSASGGVTSNVDRKLSDSPPEVERNVVGKDAASTPRSATSKKRKVLSIIIPSKESSNGGGMRQLSAAEERKIDEAMQLASSFARLSTHHDHSGLLTPRSTCSGSSKESLDSPGPGAAGGHVFRFGGLRRKVTGKEEKRTFVDGLSLTCNATDIFTPDAQAAYNQLVSVSPPASATSTMTTKLPSRRETRRAHRHQPDNPIPRPSTSRRRSAGTSTLHDALRTISATTQTLPTSEGRARILYQRSASLTEDKVISGAKSAHRIDVRSISSSDSTLSPASAQTPPTEDDVLASPPLHRAPSPPPPVLPPRVPIKPIRRDPEQRPHVPAKQRAMSEAQRSLQAVQSVDVALPRRATRSTSDTVESRSSEGCQASDDVLDSLRDSNDSVFSSSSSSNDDKRPQEQETVDEDGNPPRQLAPAPPVTRSTSTGRLDVVDLGLHDPVDTFWNGRVHFDQATLSRSEQDLLDQPTVSVGAQGFGSSDAVSYEDLMEFALDGPRHRVESEDGECDEVRLMRKLLTTDVTVDECMDALSETQWDVHNAIKLVKLGQLLRTGLADKQTCKHALMSCQWNVQDAATFLLNGQQEHTADT